MKEKDEETKNNQKKNWLIELFSFLSNALNTLIEHSNAEIHKIKKLIVYYVIVYSLFIIALLFILIGLIKYFFPNEGLGFIIVGCTIIVLLSIYTIIHKLDS